MLYLRKTILLMLSLLFLVQPVFAQDTTDPQAAEVRPDIISAVLQVAELPANWSPLSSASDAQQFLLRHTTAPIYALSEDGTWTPVLAQALPEDVTRDYAGTHGIPEHATGGYAYRIVLRGDACWEDGVPITAEACRFSIGKLLEDEENRHNWTFLAGAKDVLSGTKRPGDEILSLRQAQVFNVNDALASGYTDLYIDTTGFWGLDAGWRPVTSRIRLQDFAMPGGMDERFVSPAYLYTRYLADGAESSRFQSSFIGIRKPASDSMTLEDLGVLCPDTRELILLLQEPLAPSSLMQKLEQLFLFREDYWGKNFATSPETYCAYGPYRVAVSDTEQIILEPNAAWWGEPVGTDFDRIICRIAGKD